MTPWSLLLLWTWPLLLAALAPVRRLWWLPAAGALPALIVALVPPESRLELPWLLLGTHLDLDGPARGFLLFTAMLWLAAGVHAAFGMRGDAHARRFNLMFLLTMAGNLWLIVGQDLVSFYTGFAIMGLASYVLIVHDGDVRALHAGRVYLVLALAGEMALLAALLMIGTHTDTLAPSRGQLVGLGDLAIGLAILGLGVKAGLAPLHLWLPLAHPAAPVAASAVLSGVMIKVAILGWLRFLPVGESALPGWGALLSLGGLVTIWLALLAGLGQRDPKVVLAYSSISKIGLLILLLGLMMVLPSLAPLGIGALTLYAAHHALAKGGLFLGVGLRKQGTALQPLVLAGLVLLALSLAGAPFTSGAVTKYAVKPLLESAEWGWLAAVLAASTVATTALMARFIWVCVGLERHPAPGLGWPGAAWGLLILLAALFPFVLGTPAAWPTNATTVAVGLALSAAMAGVAIRWPALPRPLIGRIPPGDLLVLVQPLLRDVCWLGRLLWRALRPVQQLVERHLAQRLMGLLAQPLAGAEPSLRHWPVAGATWLTVGGLLLGTLLIGRSQLPPGIHPSTSVDMSEVEALSEPDIKADSLGAPAPLDDEPETGRGLRTDESSAADVSVAAADSGSRAAEAVADPGPGGVAETKARSEGTGQSVPKAGDTVAAAREGDREKPAPTRVADELSLAEAAPICDPRTPFVLTHPQDPSDRIELDRCVETSSGEARPIQAPPLTNALVRLVQEHLRVRGQDPGPIDGLIGPLTRAAIRDYQRTQGLRPTGAVDFRLLERLIRDSG